MAECLDAVKKSDVKLTHRERFIRHMDYGVIDRLPNYELGVWPQTVDRWEKEGLPLYSITENFFVGEEMFQMDPREYIPVNFFMLPPFDHMTIEKTDRYEIFQDNHGRIRKALVEGTVRGCRLCMDQFLKFPIETPADWEKVKKRYIQAAARYPARWQDLRLPAWKQREHVLVLGQNCAAEGFYWRARELMGTENLSYAWFDYPEMMHDMMTFYADYTMEVCRPILEKIDVEYFNLNEDMAMKTGPLLSPATFKNFIFPHLKRLCLFLKSHGVRYIILDTDGNCEPLISMLMDAGVDCIWPLERAAGMDPVQIRKKFGKNLRLWGGVDKMRIAKGKQAIDTHLKELAPLVEEGGYLPFFDHTVHPDVSFQDFQYYIQRKMDLLNFNL